MTVRDQMLAEHSRLENLFARLLEAFTTDSREETQSLWTELEHGLEAHFEQEEHYLFPLFARVFPAETNALKAEHRQIRDQLATLGVGVDLKLVHVALARDFIEALRAHANREDRLLYRWAEESASPTTLHPGFERLGGRAQGLA